MSKKILSLDGGGSWAILQAIALKSIYSDTAIGTNCRSILNQFDLIIANSGGSLTLAAMIEHADEDIDTVIDMFKNEADRKAIFNALKFFQHTPIEEAARLLHFGPKYDASKKLHGLTQTLPKAGGIKLNRIGKAFEINPDLIICGFDYDTTRAVFFRSNQNSPASSRAEYEYTLADAVNASSNAPVNYFDNPVKVPFGKGETPHQLWDGAVGGYNNPVLVGLTEAFAMFKNQCQRSFDDIKVLSLGTGNTLLPIHGFTASDVAEAPELMKTMETPSFKGSILKLAESILSEPPDAANYMAHMFLGGDVTDGCRAGIVRMNPMLQPFFSSKESNGKKDTWVFPPHILEEDRQEFVDLLSLDMDAVEQADVLKIEKLGSWWTENKVVNQSIRYEGRKFTSKIGHATFSDAKVEWLSRCNIHAGMVAPLVP